MIRQNSFLASSDPLAFYGLSRKGKGFAYEVLNAVRNHQPELSITAIHPDATELPSSNLRVVRSAANVDPLPTRAVVVLKAKDAQRALEDAAKAGIKEVWLVMDACSKANRDLAQDKGIEVVEGCPLLFVPKPSFPHNIHRAIAKLFGKV